MKRVEAIIQTNKLNDVLKGLHNVGIGGVTVIQSQGQGTDEPPLVGELYSKTTVMTVVEDEKVNDIMNTIADAVCTNSKGDGKIFVSNVEESMDICTKEKGIHTL